MKTWQCLVLCVAILAGAILHAAASRYAVHGHRFSGAAYVTIKLDRWTGKTWKYHATAGWQEIGPNPFDVDDYLANQPPPPAAPPRLAAEDLDTLASAFEAQGAAQLAKLSRERAAELRSGR